MCCHFDLPGVQDDVAARAKKFSATMDSICGKVRIALFGNFSLLFG